MICFSPANVCSHLSQNEENGNNVPIERLSIQHPQVRDSAAALICHEVVTLMALCFCVFCCGFCSLECTPTSLQDCLDFSCNNSEQLTDCSAVPTCPSVSSSKDSLPPGPISEAIINFENEPNHFEVYCCNPVRKYSKSDGYSELISYV